MAVHPLPLLPLVLDVEIPEEQALAGWRRQAAYSIAGALALATTFIAMFWIITQHMGRQEAQNIVLSRAVRVRQESESRLRDFAELASDWFWEQDADLRFTYVGLNANTPSNGGGSLLGTLRWDISGNTGALGEWERHRADLMAHRSFHGFRFDQADQLGRVHKISISGVPLYDATGAFVGYRGIGHDITDQIEAEEALRQAKERAERAETLLHDAIDSITEGFAIYDDEDRLVTCNEGYRQLHSRDVPWSTSDITFLEILRHGLARRAYPDAIDREQEWLDNWLKRHQEASGTTEQPMGDGKWVLVTKRRMRNGGVAELRLDITALKQTQAALRQSETRLERAQEIAGIGSWEVNLSHNECGWSRQLYHIHGLSSEFQPGRDYLGFNVHRDDADVFSPWLEALQAGSGCNPIEIRIARPDQNIRVLAVEGRALTDADGVIRRLTGTAQDITERRFIESQLAQAQKMEAIGNLTGGIAHDFNNVLGVIIGNLDLLGRLVKTDPEASGMCSDALEGATRCADLIRRLLAFARRQPLRPAQIDVNRLVANIARLLDGTIGEDVTLTLRLDAAIWPVMADPAQLEAALVNLATNARDAMPDGGRLEISTRRETVEGTHGALGRDVRPGEYAVIEVTDTGTGIQADIIGHIFEPFFTTKPPGEGTGLGLSMAFGFVKQSGGHLGVVSKLGQGTAFQIYLPRVGDGMVAEAQATNADTPIAGGDETILVVEDNPSLRATALRQLHALGYRVHEAENAESALAILQAEDHIDLLFTDVVMPGTMNGLALAHHAKQIWPHIVVLLTSGFVGSAGLARLEEGHPFVLLNKPYRNDELARQVRKVLKYDNNSRRVHTDSASQ